MKLFEETTMWLTIAVIVLLITFLIAYKTHRHFTLWSRQNVPQSIQMFLDMPKYPVNYIDPYYLKKFSTKVIGTYNLFTPALIVADLELAKKVMTSDFQTYANRIKLSSRRAISGDSVLFLPVHHWKSQRQLIMPAFTISKMKAMQPLIEQSVDDLIGNINEQISEHRSVINVKPLFYGYVLDVIASVGFDTKVGSERECIFSYFSFEFFSIR